MRKLGGHLTYANVTATLALVIAVAGGTAYAANTIGSSDIIDESILTADLKNGEVKVADIGQGAVATDELVNGQVKTADLAPDSVNAAKIADGQVKSPEIANGQVQAEDLAPGVAPGASGARAWGLFDGDSTLLRSKNVTSVTRLGVSGPYCVDPGPGIDPTTAVMVVSSVTPYSATSESEDDVSIVEWDSAAPDCPAETMEVRTFYGNGATQSFGNTDQGGFTVLPHIQGFSFVIP